MPRNLILLCCGVGLFFSTSHIVQSQPAKPVNQRFINYQLEQQKNWQNKQLPANSVLYRHSVKYPAAAFRLSREADRPVTIRMPSYMIPLETSNFNPSLQQYLQDNKWQNIQWEKVRWRKDPAKGIGADLIKSFAAPASFLPSKN
ncbi:hypothetical protein BC349_10290 [Flavihumibacter stibioxidans]|uniref:Uncharacterized protein n=2 Tax=Flavihumibacter stibioxidans TaxID=1834163 RepID=A0ABR7MA11_9BACT|nr:hypothetical protein [Flavihumibacter stibioxidans]